MIRNYLRYLSRRQAEATCRVFYILEQTDVTHFIYVSIDYLTEWINVNENVNYDIQKN